MISYVLMVAFLLFSQISMAKENQLYVRSNAVQLHGRSAVVEIDNDCHFYDVIVGNDCIALNDKKSVAVQVIRKGPNKLCLKKKTHDLLIDLSKLSCEPVLLILKLQDKTAVISLYR